MVLRVHDDDVVPMVAPDGLGRTPGGGEGGPAVAPVARFAGSGHGGNDARRGIDFPHGGVQPVYDVDVTVGIDLERVQVVQGRLGCRAAVSGVALTPAARDGRDDPRILVDAA